MRFLMICIALFALSGVAHADDHIFNSTTALKEQVVRLGDEALEVVKTPLDTDGYGLVGTLAVAGAVGLTYVFDDDIRTKLQGSKSKGLDMATDVGNLVGDPFLHLGIAAAVYGGGIFADSPRWKETGEMLGEAIILADATTFVLKETIGKARPFVNGNKGSFRPGQFKTDYDSLPSMHTSSSFAMASVMAATSKSMATKVLYYSAAAFVGFSRIYQDKHWASDVVLSAAIGELCGRIVTATHVKKGSSKVSFVPLVSENSAGLAMLGRW
ncbi:MAG: phosphatase PAP2 family protein [Desulfobacteraceae bacterium]|nr:phosphatase PAP2 family protein [Desulfobacteraceae bacterium]